MKENPTNEDVIKEIVSDLTKTNETLGKLIDTVGKLDTKHDNIAKETLNLVKIITETLKDNMIILKSLLVLMFLLFLISIFKEQIISGLIDFSSIIGSLWKSLSEGWQTTLFNTILVIVIFFAGRFSKK